MFSPQKKWETVRKVFAVLVIAALAAVACFSWYVNSAQRAARKAAEDYVARTEPLIAANPEFSNVVVYEFSGFGCARIHGSVATGDKLVALHQFIDATQPPRNIQVMWTVKVDPNPDPKAKEGYPFPAATSPAGAGG